MWTKLLLFNNIVHLVNSIIACFMSSLLIYLILYKTQKQMKSFSKLLLLSAIMDFIANWSFTIIQAQVEVDGIYLYVRSGNMAMKYHGRWKCIHVSLYAVFYTVSHYSLPIQSLSRYFIVCLKKPLPAYIVTSMYLFIGGYAITAGAVFAYHFVPVEENPAVLQRLSTLTFWKNDVDSFCYFEIFSFPVLFFIGMVNYCSCSGMCIIAFTAFKVHRLLQRSKAHMSKKTMEMHRQLGIRIILEAIFPTISAVDTVSLCIVIIFISKYEGGLFVLMYLPYSFVSIINCFATIISIKSYRQTVFGLIKCSRNIGISDISTTSQAAAVNPASP